MLFSRDLFTINYNATFYDPNYSIVFCSLRSDVMLRREHALPSDFPMKRQHKYCGANTLRNSFIEMYWKIVFDSSTIRLSMVFHPSLFLIGLLIALNLLLVTIFAAL